MAAHNHIVARKTMPCRSSLSFRRSGLDGSTRPTKQPQGDEFNRARRGLMSSARSGLVWRADSVGWAPPTGSTWWAMPTLHDGLHLREGRVRALSPYGRGWAVSAASGPGEGTCAPEFPSPAGVLYRGDRRGLSLTPGGVERGRGGLIPAVTRGGSEGLRDRDNRAWHPLSTAADRVMLGRGGWPRPERNHQ